MPDDRVKHVAMQHQKPSPICSDVNNFFGDLHAAELQQCIIAQPFVMVAGDIYHTCTFADLAQYLLDDVVVGLRPIP